MQPDPAAIFGNLDLEGRSRVVAALSGGSDSTALLVLLLDHLNALTNAPRVLAVTVDHGLRAGSAGEASAVADLCRRMGVDHRIVRWPGAKPASGIIAAAREARYDLLALAAREAGTDLVLTGHTADDQAETVAMRAARGDGAGLAGMAAATLFDGSVWIVRPLLGLRRQALRDHLSARGVGWIDEPSNDNPAFERVRVRAALHDGEAESLAADAQARGAARMRLAAEAAAFVRQKVQQPLPGLFRLDWPLAGGSEDPVLLAMRALLACAGGTPHLPDAGRTLALLDHLSTADPLRVALSRALVDARRSGIWIVREARNVPRVALGQGVMTWDGRWRVTSTGARSGLCVGPVGDGSPADSADVPASLARAAWHARPGLFDGDRFVGLPDGPEARALGVSAVPVAAPHARFRPGFDLELGDALDRLLDAPRAPAAPWKKHIGDRP